MLKAFPLRIAKRHSLELEIALALILKPHGQSATQIIKNLDRRFPHDVGRLDCYWHEDEASAQLNVFGDFRDFNGVGSCGERGSYLVRKCKRANARSVPDATAAT